VAAGGDFRHYSSVDSLKIDTAGNYAAKHFKTVFYDGGGGLITGRFNSQYFHLFYSILKR
jgi:hypothetical protein